MYDLWGSSEFDFFVNVFYYWLDSNRKKEWKFSCWKQQKTFPYGSAFLLKRKETAKNQLSPAHCALTYVGSAQSLAQRPRPDVRRLAVDGQTLDAADEAAIGPRGPDQPVGTGGAAQVQWGSEGDLAVLALQHMERGSAVTAARHQNRSKQGQTTRAETVAINPLPSWSRPSVLFHPPTWERPDTGVSLSIRSQPLIPSRNTVTVCHWPITTRLSLMICAAPVPQLNLRGGQEVTRRRDDEQIKSRFQ